jgi:hypothetical protein
VDDWDIPDPAGRFIEEMREIREMIAERVRRLVQERIHAIRRHPRSHRSPLAKLLPSLIEEFGETRAPEVIRGCADRVLDEYNDVPVRSHTLTLARRRTCDCLRHEHRTMLETAAG